MTKILVTIKHVVDPYVPIQVKADGSGVDTRGAKMAINPFCEIAVEEAVRLKEANIATEIVVVSVGSNVCQQQIRSALALGADRGVQIDTVDDLQPLAIAKLLKALVDKERPELVLMGKQSIDNDNNQTGQLLADLWGVGQGTFTSKLQVADGSATATREVDGGLQTLTLTLPAVITTDLRLNEPRYASLPNIMQAKKKAIEVLTPEALGVAEQALQSRLTTLKVEPPAPRKAGVIVESVEELVDKLKNEARVI